MRVEWSSKMDKKKMKKTLIGIGRDLLIAFLVVLLVMLILFAYCRVWPPMVPAVFWTQAKPWSAVFMPQARQLAPVTVG